MLRRNVLLNSRVLHTFWDLSKSIVFQLNTVIEGKKFLYIHSFILFFTSWKFRMVMHLNWMVFLSFNILDCLDCWGGLENNSILLYLTSCHLGRRIANCLFLCLERNRVFMVLKEWKLYPLNAFYDRQKSGIILRTKGAMVKLHYCKKKDHYKSFFLSEGNLDPQTA